MIFMQSSPVKRRTRSSLHGKIPIRYMATVFVVLAVLALLLLPLNGCAEEKQGEACESQLKVAVLHIGPVGDYGWTYEGYLGAQKMAEALHYVNLVQREEACGPDASDVLRE
jgi:basic membrane lipoprotein Med (substrate-binding protein (PBP1-ABC) superfamily)